MKKLINKFALSTSIIALLLLAIFAVDLVFKYRTANGPWKATFYNSVNFTGEPLVFNVDEIDFFWNLKAPHKLVRKNGFSAVFERSFVVEREGEFVFKLSSDDGARFFINDKLLIDNWGQHLRQRREASYRLSPGEHRFRIEYFDASGIAVLTFSANEN